jgi:hypothetical protein
MNRLEQSNTFDDGRLTIVYVCQLKIIEMCLLTFLKDIL